jgi:Beta-lactamase
LQLVPAGGFFTTGTDMGRFLIAHLRGGAFQNRRILRPDTLSLMHTQHFAQTTGTSGWAYGLWEDTRKGHRALLHNGGGKGYRALMYLLPQQDAGFFLAYNLADRHEEGELQEVFITEFRRRFVPPRESIDARSHEPESRERVDGDYLYVRRARTTMESFISVVNRVRVTRGENGTLTITGSSDGPVQLTGIGPQVFRRSDDRGMVAFEAASETSPQRLLMVADSGFPAVYERVPLIASLRVQVTWLAGMVLVFLYAAAWQPSVAALRRTRTNTSDGRRWLPRLASIASALNLVFLVGFPLAFLGPIEGGFPEFVYGVPVVARLLLLIPPITAFIGLAASIAVIGMWWHGRASMSARIGHSLVAVALLSFVVFAWYWNLLVPLRAS